MKYTSIYIYYINHCRNIVHITYIGWDASAHIRRRGRGASFNGARDFTTFHVRENAIQMWM